MSVKYMIKLNGEACKRCFHTHPHNNVHPLKELIQQHAESDLLEVLGTDDRLEFVIEPIIKFAINCRICELSYQQMRWNGEYKHG